MTYMQLYMYICTYVCTYVRMYAQLTLDTADVAVNKEMFIQIQIIIV